MSQNFDSEMKEFVEDFILDVSIENQQLKIIEESIQIWQAYSSRGSISYGPENYIERDREGENFCLIRAFYLS